MEFIINYFKKWCKYHCTTSVHRYNDIDRYNCVMYGQMIEPTVCIFCYRSRGRSQGEAGGQADLTVELVPWETCSIA